jgi:hypothetical protein
MSVVISLKKKQRFHRHEKGQSLVELAIGITILLWLLSGIVDVGRAIFTQFALQDAAEEGLVYGIGFPDQCDEIEARVLSNLENGALPTSPEITVTVDSSPCGTVTLVYGLSMDVEVSSTFMMSMPFLAGNSLTLKGTANGTILRPPPES